MSANTRRLLAWLPMAGVIVLAIRVAIVWKQLPSLVMSHFDLQGNPDGWMPRTVFFVTSFALMLFIVGLFAVMTERVARRKPSIAWALLLITWTTGGLLTAVFWGAVTANLNRGPLHIFPFWIPLAVLVPVVLAVSIDWRWWLSRDVREAAKKVSSAHLVAEQSHGSRRWGLFFALITLGLVLLALMLSFQGRSKLVLSALAGATAIVASAGISAWRGFKYRFTTEGIEIRALGIRLRSIPLSEIKEFHSERCNPLTDFGGWGVKGFGTDTAYIWSGRKVLHISTWHGDVYLGHNNPDRLVRDLEAIMNPAH